jgi:hypothetical protein
MFGLEVTTASQQSSGHQGLTNSRTSSPPESSEEWETIKTNRMQGNEEWGQEARDDNGAGKEEEL